MKKVEVLSFVVDTVWDRPDLKHIIERWIETEEGKFIEKYSLVPLEIRTIHQPNLLWSNKIELWAILEEKHEMFWRLKFK